MRKVIKISAKILLALLAVLIIVPLLLSMLLAVPAVQNFAVQRAVRSVSEALDTKVGIDRIQIGLFGRVKIRGFYVEDYQQDTLLYVGKLNAFVTGFGIFSDGIILNRAEISDAKLHIRETPEGDMNIKQIVNRITNPDKEKKGNFTLTIRKATITNMDFRLERIEHRNPPFGIDFGNMHLYDMSARINYFTIDGNVIQTFIGTLSAREQSGFMLDHLSGLFYLTTGGIGFEDMLILTPRSMVQIPYISLAGNSWEEYKDFIGQVRLDGLIENSTLTTDDIAYFAPSLKNWNTEFRNINIELAGMVSDFEVAIKDLQVGEGTNLTANGKIQGLPDIRNTHFDLTIPALHTSATAATGLATSIGGAQLSEQLVDILGNSGNIDIDARFVGVPSAFDMQLGVATDVGKLTTKLLIKPAAKGRQSIRGGVETRNLRLGKLLGREELFGNATLSAQIDGIVGRGFTDANIVGNLMQFGFHNYIYDSIRLDGRLRNRQFDGRITARDPNLDLDFAGLLDLGDTIPRYDFTMNLRRANLAKLNINRRDSVSELSARIEARASGRTLDDLDGRIRIYDALYLYNDKRVETKEMVIEGKNTAGSKYVEMRSDFADALFRGRTGYAEVFEYLRRSALRYIPMLDRVVGDLGREHILTTAAPNDFSMISINIRKIDPILDAITAGLQVSDNASLQLLFNPYNDHLTLKAKADYIERNRILATRLDINASNRGDSLVVYGSAEDLFLGTFHAPQLSLAGGAKQGRMQVSVGFNDTLRRTSALIGVRAEVADENGPNGRIIDFRITPSHITRGDMSWQIFANKIQRDTAHIVIDRFLVMNREQRLSLTGVASRSRQDSLTLNLSNFDLSPFARIVEGMGYIVEGRTNGTATMKSVLGGGQITADISVDSLTVNNMEAPPLRLTSRWDFARNRAGLTVINRIERDTLIRGFYDPSRVRYYARMELDSLNMGVLDPLLSGVVSNSKGAAWVNMVLQGERRDANLTGEIRVADFSTTVDFTQVTYRMPKAILKVEGNRFNASNVTVYDPEGNRGRFDIDLSLQHLSNISYDVRVAPQQMLVLNTTSRDSDIFYGKVYATGSARISGEKGNVQMVIEATTDDNSRFFLPLSGKSNIAYADFVTFRQREDIDTLDDVARRRQAFERQRKKKTETQNQMDIRLALNVQSGTEVELTVAGNTLRGRGNGVLNLHINPRANIFEMLGDYTISEGSFLFSLQNIINKKFIIDPGSRIQWNGSPMDALLNVDAIYKLKTSLQPLMQGSAGNNGINGQDNTGGAAGAVNVECVILLRERLSNPLITFEVRVPGADPETQAMIANALATPEDVNTQFAYLLLFNSFMADSAASSAGPAVSAATGLELLTNMVNNLLSGDDYNIILRYRPKSDMTGDEVDLGLSKSLINNRLFIEFEGNYVGDNPNRINNSVSNFMGEAYVTYLIDRAGSLRLKAFTQTIDRFDENQGLQETGIGVYYKEEFDNFKDLRRRVRERFTNKKRQARREEIQNVKLKIEN